MSSRTLKKDPFPTFALVATMGLLISGVLGQNSPAPGPPPTEAPVNGDSPGTQDPIAALQSVLSSIQVIEDRLELASKAVANAIPSDRETLEAEIKSLAQRRDELRADFKTIATGIDPGDYDQVLSTKFELREELDKLIRPLVEELKELTKKPREIEQLRSELGIWRRRRETATFALANLAALPQVEETAVIVKELDETRKEWDDRLQLSENRIQALSYQLEQAESSQPSIYQSVRDGLRGFFASRGLNLFLCILVFILVFLALRFLHRRISRFTPWLKKGARPFYVRVVDVSLHLFSLVGAGIAAILVLYATGDWVLMGVTMIALLALALAAKNGLPRFYDHGRLLLNLGEIREGERVVYGGIPWRVERLTFFTVLKNDRLRGGVLRLPVRQLSELVSRPAAEEGEAWFPSEEGDWIEFPEIGRARVVAQTPEFVQLVKLGGAKVTIPTVTYLESTPANLSHGFRISTTFGIDYKHQADCTGAIPEKLWAHLTREISSLVGEREHLRSLKVEFASAGASSLDYAIIADFDGSLASKFDVLTRAIQKSAVDCCNTNGWEIPFTQITVHQAG